MKAHEFTELVLTKTAGSHEEFQPLASFDADGDCIEFIAKPESFYAQRFDALVTVYYGRQTDEVVGCLIKGVSKIKQRLMKEPGFKILIQGNKVRLEWLFIAHLFTITDVKEQKIYRKLIEVADESKVEVSLSGK